MADRFVICPFCGFEFDKVDTLCEHGCPLHSSCSLIRCPSCEYDFPEEPRGPSWFRRLLRRGEEPAETCHPHIAVTELDSGQSAEVVALEGESSRRNTLAVFGLAPGSELTLIQRHPAYVVRIGETELALDADIARQILVRRPLQVEAPAPTAAVPEGPGR